MKKEQRKRQEEQRRREEIQQQRLRDQAIEAGNDIQLSLLLDTGVIEVPADIAEQLAAYRAARETLNRWRGARWQLGRSAKSDENRKGIGRLGLWNTQSQEEIEAKIGPAPNLPERPVRPTGLGVVLEFKNISTNTRRLYLRDSMLLKPTSITGPKVEAVGGYGWCSTLFRNQGRNQDYVDLEPGDTYLVRLYASDHRWDYYFTEPGTYDMQLEFTSGVQHKVGWGKRIQDDALIIQSQPVQFYVELLQ